VNDFELEVEYRITGGPSANSGIQIRSQRAADGHASGLQCDLDDGKVWLGRIYDEHGRALVMERGTRVSIAPDGRKWADPFAEAKSFASIPRPNEWNTYRVRASASRVETWVNGVFFGALDDHETKAADYSGKLAFQLHSGPGPAKVQFRNIRLRDLGKTALPPETQSVAGGTAEMIRPAGEFEFRYRLAQRLDGGRGRLGRTTGQRRHRARARPRPEEPACRGILDRRVRVRSE
jgi:hypothetical protein